jgi:fructoselysine-6-P-deglycase FrlB-like protein
VNQKVAEGLRDVFFVGAGGSANACYSAHLLLEQESVNVGSRHITSGEFNVRQPAALGPKSLAVVCSHSGATQETLQAQEIALAAGATVLAISRDRDTPLAKKADAVLTYGCTAASFTSVQIMTSLLSYALLQASGQGSGYEGAVKAHFELPGALAAVLAECDENCEQIVDVIGGAPVTYVIASGTNAATGYGLAMCYLMEMQWQNAAYYNADEFFHGAFEIVDEETAAIVMLGEDASRPLAERAARFLERYVRVPQSLDSRRFSLPGVAQSDRAAISHIALGVAARRLAEHFAERSGHALSTRRYMNKVEY